MLVVGFRLVNRVPIYLSLGSYQLGDFVLLECCIYLTSQIGLIMGKEFLTDSEVYVRFHCNRNLCRNVVRTDGLITKCELWHNVQCKLILIDALS